MKPNSKTKAISILLVDDDYITNLIHEKIITSIENVASSILSAQNGKEALQILNDTSTLPDIILLDLNMPVMGGLEFIKKFQTSSLIGKSKTRIIILSSLLDPEDMLVAKSLGITHFITKPIPGKQMVSLIFREQEQIESSSIEPLVRTK